MYPAAGTLADRRGDQRPVHLDGTQHQVAGALGRQIDATALGPGGSAGCDQGAQRTPQGVHQTRRIAHRNRDLEEPVTREVHGQNIAGAQADPAQTRLDHALIDHARPDQGCALRGRDITLVDHGGGPAGPPEGQVPRQEVSVGDVQARADKGARIDRRAVGDGDAVGVDQQELAIGAQGPRKDRGVLAGHAPEEGRQRTRLVNAHAGARADVETLEVDDRLLGGLGDQQAVRGAGVKPNATLHDPRVHRQLTPGGRCNGSGLLGEGWTEEQCRHAGKQGHAQVCSTVSTPVHMHGRFQCTVLENEIRSQICTAFLGLANLCFRIPAKKHG